MTKPKAQRKGQPTIVDNVDDDEETYSQRKSHPKKSRSKATVTSIDSSDDSDSVQITSAKKKVKPGQGSDTEIEEMDIEKETAEEELGKLSSSLLN